MIFPGIQRAIRGRISICALLGIAAFASVARAADVAADAVAAVAQLTDPARLAALPDETFAAQLGPTLGWLYVGRQRDVSPVSIIARAFRANGLDLDAERARLTRDAILRNLARADAWELFSHAPSAQALALGQPAVIQTGLHQGQFARAVLLPVLVGVANPARGREFADLALRADDELPLPPPRRLPKIRRPRADERLVERRAAAPAAVNASVRRKTPRALLPPIVYDDSLPAADPAAGSNPASAEKPPRLVPVANPPPPAPGK